MFLQETACSFDQLGMLPAVRLMRTEIKMNGLGKFFEQRPQSFSLSFSGIMCGSGLTFD